MILTVLSYKDCIDDIIKKSNNWFGAMCLAIDIYQGNITSFPGVPTNEQLRKLQLKETEILESVFEKIRITETPAFNAYIYLTEKLSTLPGSRYGKKRNHINQFRKKNPEFRLEPLTQENLSTVLCI